MVEESVAKHLNAPDQNFDPALRPKDLHSFVGQKKTKEQLSIAIQAAQMRRASLDHVLFCGPPGLGKTTLAHILAGEMGAGIKAASGPVIDRPGDLAGLLTSLEEGDILFIDEIHRLNQVVEEYLYGAMEDHLIDILIDKGPSARSVKLELCRFTLVGATTRSGLLTQALRSRFGMMHHLDFYKVDDLQQILLRSASLLAVDLQEEAAHEIAKRSRGTARIANHLLKRVRDYALVKGMKPVSAPVALEALVLLDVDHRGLDDMDLRILRTIIEHYGGGPVGLNTIAVAVGEEAHTIEEVYEPYLILSGFIKRTAQGRQATRAAWQHLKLQNPAEGPTLFTDT